MLFIQVQKNIFFGKLLVSLLATQKSDKTPPCVRWHLPHKLHKRSEGLYDGFRTYLIYTTLTIAPSSLSANGQSKMLLTSHSVRTTCRL